MIKSASQSSLTNDVKYRSMSAGVVPSNEFLIATTVLNQATPSVTLDFSGLSGIYKHLKIVAVVKSTSTLDSGNRWDRLVGQFNSDANGSSYITHTLQGSNTSSTVISYIDTNTLKAVGFASRVNENFAVGIIEIIDAFNLNKNKTVRALTGMNGTGSSVGFQSGLWLNTGTLTSLRIFSEDGAASLAQNSRFSIYGVTA